MEDNLITWEICDKCKRDYPVGREIETTEDLVKDGKAMRDWVSRLLIQIGDLEEKNKELDLENRVNNASIKGLRKEYWILVNKVTQLEKTLLPVCEYAAEIYNCGIPAVEMPADTIQRLNRAFKMFGG